MAATTVLAAILRWLAQRRNCAARLAPQDDGEIAAAAYFPATK
jgi:hypothetical protein